MPAVARRTLKTIKELSAAYRTGSTSPPAVLDEALSRIERFNPSFNCFITVLTESAKAAAAESEARHSKGSPLGPLDGVPIAVKDLFYIEGVRCTAGSKVLSKHIATYDSTVVRRIREAGAVIVGTTNLHEFAAGVTSSNPHYGPVRNPWDITKIPGGSSGGSAAAVASGMAAAALGTDTAGSVRIPAALCGVVGLKPTYGRISRLGVVPLSSSFDTVGTLTSSAWDAAALLQVLAGGDPDDLTTSATPVPTYGESLGQEVAGTRVGVPKKFFRDLIDPHVEEEFRDFVGTLAGLGCQMLDSEVEAAQESYSLWLPIRLAEAASFHRKWLQDTPELYGEDVRRSLEQGMKVSAVDYVGAINSRPNLIERFLAAMNDVDILAVPTACIPAPRIGRTEVEIGGSHVEVRAALIRLTTPFNAVGFPAISVPAGTVDGLPVGAQLVARPFEEEKLLAVADALEAKSGPHPKPTS